MNKRTVWIATSILGALAVAGILIFHGVPFGRAPGETVTEQPGKQKQPPQVRVLSATRSNISKTLELTGSVEPYRVARLASPAEGPVVGVRIRESDRVATGETLLSIGRKKGVDALVASLREELNKEEENLNRTRQLVESEALPGEQLDEAKAAYEKVRALLIKAEETAQDYIIQAPWTGVVSRVNVKEGEFIAPRAVLLEMYDPASLVIRTSIPERHAAEVTAGMHVDVRLDAHADRVIPSRIDRVYPYLDSRLRTRTVEIVLEEDFSLLPGMFARLSISLESAEGVVVAPLEALVRTPKGQIVFVFEEGKAAARAVETGIEAADRVEIVSGIRPGDRVIVAGNEKLKDGADVRIVVDDGSRERKEKKKAESPAGPPGKTGDG